MSQFAFFVIIGLSTWAGVRLWVRADRDLAAREGVVIVDEEGNEIPISQGPRALPPGEDVF